MIQISDDEIDAGDRLKAFEATVDDIIVFVATASKHRRAAFEAADFLMDYLKTEAVFWKKETTEAGETWIEPRVDDYQDAARWRPEKVS